MAVYELEDGFEGEYFYNGQAGDIRADVNIRAYFPRNAEQARLVGNIGPNHAGSITGINEDGSIDTTRPSQADIERGREKTAFKIAGQDSEGILLNNATIDSNGAFTGTAALYRNVAPETQSGIVEGSFVADNISDGKATVPQHVAGQLLLTGFSKDPSDPSRADNALTGVFLGTVTPESLDSPDD